MIYNFCYISKYAGTVRSPCIFYLLHARTSDSLSTSWRHLIPGPDVVPEVVSEEGTHGEGIVHDLLPLELRRRRRLRLHAGACTAEFYLYVWLVYHLTIAGNRHGE